MVMMHIKNDDMANELNDQINFPSVLHVHSIEEDGRDFIDGDRIDDKKYFRARKAAYPTRLYNKKFDIWVMFKRATEYARTHATLDADNDAAYWDGVTMDKIAE